MSEYEMILLTEGEVADLLRCKPSKVRRLRQSGKLAYTPGRPVMIRQKAVDAYLEAVEAKAIEMQKPEKSSIEAAAERAREKWMLMHLRDKVSR